jgi:dihydroorotase
MAKKSKALVLRDAVIFTPDGRVEGDLRIEDGRIADIGKVSGARADDFACDGQWVWPGAVDGHVHFRDPGFPHKETFETGSAAAISGGVTTVFDMPNTMPTTTNLERLEEKREIARNKSHCNWGLFFGATTKNLDQARAAENIAGLKIFMGCSTGDLLVYRTGDLSQIFAGYRGRICVHAESELRLRQRKQLFLHREDAAVHSEIRDPDTAAEAVRIALKLAAMNGRHLHVLHLSTRAELDEIAAVEDGADGFRVTCEVCPHHLFMDVSAYEKWGTFVRMNPPLRSEEDREEMWRALQNGRIQMIATDHAPHTKREKSQEYWEAPSGVPGVETMLPLMLNAASRGECTYEEVLEWCCHAPASIYSVQQRHRLETGNWADIVVIDPKLERRVRDKDQWTNCGWSPWRRRKIVGWPTATFVNGNLVFRREGDDVGELIDEDSRGVEVTFG